MSQRQHHDILVLAGTIILAVLLHVGGIVLLKDMEVTLTGLRHSGLERLTYNDSEDHPEEEMEVLEEELATLFNQLVSRDIEEIPEQELLDEPEKDLFEPMSFDDMAPLSVNEELPEFPEENLAFEDLADLTDFSSTELGIQVNVDINDQFLDQLVEATDQMQGYAVIDAPTFDDGDDSYFNAAKRRLDTSLGVEGAEAGARLAHPSRQGNIARSQDFDLRVSYAPNEDGDDYIFQVELVPKRNVRFRRISHNMSFVLDRSFSIAKDRYEESKKAVSEALEFLEPDDSFNILVFDKKVVKMAEHNLPATPENIAIGRKFLDSQKHGGLFASTELYTSLDKIIPQAVADTEVNTAILFSDGDTLLKQQEQRRSIGDWTQRNGGKVSLFSLAAGDGNNLALLELLSTFNKGRLVYAKKHTDITERLKNLVRAIRNPIGKEIVVTAVCDDPKMRMTVYPRKQRLPELYEDTPYVIYGNTNKLRDFHIFIQGKYYERWLDIKHKVSFRDATPAALTIERRWTMHKAFDHYERYMADGKIDHVREANRLLAPFKIQTAFR